MFIVAPFIDSTEIAIIAEADLRCGDFLSEKNCRHKFVVSTSFWHWLLNFSSVLTSLKYTATLLWIVNAFEYADVSWEFWVLILVFVFLKYDFFVFILFAIFCGTNFFIFQNSVCLVKKSRCVHCCSIHRFY